MTEGLSAEEIAGLNKLTGADVNEIIRRVDAAPEAYVRTSLVSAVLVVGEARGRDFALSIFDIWDEWAEEDAYVELNKIADEKGY